MTEKSETSQKQGGNSHWRQFWLLLWKNYLLQKKKPILTLFVVLLPIFPAILSAIGRGDKESFGPYNNEITYDSFTIEQRYQSRNWTLTYAPNTTLVARIMSRTATILGTSIKSDQGFASETALEEYIMLNDRFFGAIVFAKSSWVTLPKKLSYKIRLEWNSNWKTDVIFPGRKGSGPSIGSMPNYHEAGFLTIQRAVDLSLIAEVNPSFNPMTTTLKTQLKRYPYPAYRDDRVIPFIAFYLPILFLIGFIIIPVTICQEIVLEKENKFKESMKLMGMRMWLYWSSWFVKYLLFMLVSIFFMTVLFCCAMSSKGPVFAQSSGTVIFVFLLLYSLSLVTFCFLISTLVFKASYGSAIGGILFFLLYVPYFYVMTVQGKMTPMQKLLASLDFNFALGFGCFKIAQLEAIAIGVQWNTMWLLGDGYTMGHILIMLLVDSIIYSILTWYLDAVIPGEFGTPQSLYFPFTKEYWMRSKTDKIKLSNEDFITRVPEDKRPYFEAPLQNANAGIQIRGLTKDFGSKANPAVNNLNIDIYESNITALVGHNGAGKTTTMFMLTGFLPPSKGTAFINGLDITREMDNIRQNLGLCPQHNILFDTLTVKEHLIFFAVLKGSPFKKASLDMNEMIKVLHLEDKIRAKVKTLSGGQKRKLSVGIALISGSKFVILDEPTSGMDPESRRQTWDILQSQRKDRTMILSTHYMDEADILGDRIAIMSNGEIQCYGSPMFLKNKFGVGYHLTIAKARTCDVDRLRDVITSRIPMAQMASHEAGEVMFILPSNQVSKFEGLFETLETDRVMLGIESFGVSVTTMEEVFLKVKDSSALEVVRRMSITTNAEEKQGHTSYTGVQYSKETGWKRQNIQLRAMFYKRLIHSVRNYALIFGQILIPVLFTILACLNFYDPPRVHRLLSLTLDLTHFKGSITPYDINRENDNAQLLASCYEVSVSRHSTPVFINNEPNYSTMDAYLLTIGKRHKHQYNWNYQIGATIVGSNTTLTIIGYYNNEAYHTIAISLSYLGNTLMQCFGNKEYQIETINHPLPKHSVERAIKPIDDATRIIAANKSLGFTVCVSFGLAILSATFVVFLIKERKSGAKHSQLVSGVRLHNFWLATFLWDFVNYLIPCILIVVVIASFHTDGYWHNAWIILLGLILHGFFILPFTYVMSFLFGEASVGFIWVFAICFLAGTFATVTVFILEMLQEPTWQIVETVLYFLFPTFCIDSVLWNIYKNYNNYRLCNIKSGGLKLSEFCADVRQDREPCCPGKCGHFCFAMVDNKLSWTLPGVGRPLVFMVLQGTVFFLILCIIETDMFGRILSNEQTYMCLRQLTLMIPARVTQATLAEMNAEEDGKIIEDSDVVNERQRIHSQPIQELVKTDAVVIQDLTKLYEDFMAVNRLSIGVSQKECFGLLGVNGAGKTTVFKMLTGEIWPSFGKAYIAGISLQDDLAEVRQKIGYCAQFDSIIDQMTVRETLWMYACAHGIPDQVRQEVINRLIEHLTLKPYTNKRAGNLSGGNKRKLCVAVALMGNPTVVFLDEPTTGVDPEARRHVWNTLAAARNAGTTIILTSHSMEECEAICTRIGILVNGRFLCLGSLQHLRDKFSDGYTLTIKLQRSSDTDKPEELQKRIEKLKTFISQTFPESVLKDQHENLLNYEVKTRVVKWFRIFGIMEKAKVTYQIEDYSVGQTTLEQLFIGFARKQNKPRVT